MRGRTKLLEAQGEVCALTGLKLQFSSDCDDKEMLCSLDRIDSSGQYEEGNLQVVCRFSNRGKSNGVDEEFRKYGGGSVRRTPVGNAIYSLISDTYNFGVLPNVQHSVLHNWPFALASRGRKSYPP